jgi:hypothetical protein
LFSADTDCNATRVRCNSEQRYSWKGAQACQYEVQKATRSAEALERTSSAVAEKNAAFKDDMKDFAANKPEASELKRLEQV